MRWSWWRRPCPDGDARNRNRPRSACWRAASPLLAWVHRVHAVTGPSTELPELLRRWIHADADRLQKLREPDVSDRRNGAEMQHRPGPRGALAVPGELRRVRPSPGRR